MLRALHPSLGNVYAEQKPACPLMAILSDYHGRNCPSDYGYVLIRTHSSPPLFLLMHNRSISKIRSGLRVSCCSPTPGSQVQQTTSLISTASRMTTGCCTRMRILARYTPYTIVNLPTAYTGQDRRSYGPSALTISRLAYLELSLHRLRSSL
jgi:hypothetical protein